MLLEPTRSTASTPSSSIPSAPAETSFTRAREACVFCLQWHHLRRTLRIALIVGVVLTLINQGGVIAAGDATTATWVRCGLNFVVPFLVSNAGLLSGRR